MNFDITILGSSSALPTATRFMTAQHLDIGGKHVLIDCGEGTQIQLRKYHISLQKIDIILISHAHADHFLGLPGLLSSMSLLGRVQPLHVYCPAPVAEFIQHFITTFEAKPHFPITWHILTPDTEGEIWSSQGFSIHAHPLKHGVPCHAFIFRERPPLRNIQKACIEEFALTIAEIVQLKQGIDVQREDGTLLAFEQLTQKPKPPRSYAFITDTLFYPALAEKIKPIRWIYHEATFAHHFLKRARQTCHSTAQQAGQFAKLAQAEHLIIGHFSVRYDDLTPLQKECELEFTPVELAEEGKKWRLLP